MLHRDDAGMVSAIDINKGRFRILGETPKLQNVDDVVTAVHADLRNFSPKNRRAYQQEIVSVFEVMNACMFVRCIESRFCYLCLSNKLLSL
ncbi:hypothetical protein MRB53_023234 [Persea americana]|uniref:Uncharacterized protein n=1 Tax=Persea americana TaxID=3435 RepID=A0ACC2L8Z8_PERAE|nr:hypothetical protein MRB53_023234 [Persea americana]